jgi:uncharacterized small protein (DUF1192 family)
MTIKEGLKVFVIILTAITMSVSILVAITSYFAKSSTVELIDERLDISIMDDRINQQQHEIDRNKALIEFERKEAEKTAAEEEILMKQAMELEELKQARNQRYEQYEKSR